MAGALALRPHAPKDVLALGQVAHHVLGVHGRNRRAQRRQRPHDAVGVEKVVALHGKLADPVARAHAHKGANPPVVAVAQIHRHPGNRAAHEPARLAVLAAAIQRPVLVGDPAPERGRAHRVELGHPACNRARGAALVSRTFVRIHPHAALPLPSLPAATPAVGAPRTFPRPVELGRALNRAPDGLRPVGLPAPAGVPLVAHKAGITENPVHPRLVARAPERQLVAQRHVSRRVVAAVRR